MRTGQMALLRDVIAEGPVGLCSWPVGGSAATALAFAPRRTVATDRRVH
ncbi:hypothetical protein SGL43_04083 [Streptomyces globisporus]|uniref:Uncharacterized protein n=1 Tax=Streptomyces globisporus TaxID=1908 RepID=A0ABM9H0B9_STRGL|nr:hypothetical protein SGL43_04083 [Streptomyces globisporus]